MEYAIALRLDAVADAAVRDIWQSVADAGIGDYMLRLKYPPHLTLAVIDEKTPMASIKAAFNGPTEGPPIALQLGEVRRFEGTPVVWLAADGGRIWRACIRCSWPTFRKSASIRTIGPASGCRT